MTSLESLDAELVSMATSAISQSGHSSDSPPKIVSGLGLELEMAVSDTDKEELWFAVKLRLWERDSVGF